MQDCKVFIRTSCIYQADLDLLITSKIPTLFFFLHQLLNNRSVYRNFGVNYEFCIQFASTCSRYLHFLKQYLTKQLKMLDFLFLVEMLFSHQRQFVEHVHQNKVRARHIHKYISFMYIFFRIIYIFKNGDVILWYRAFASKL